MPEVGNMKLGHMRNLIMDIHTALGQADIAYSGFSGGGINVVGDDDSIKAVTVALHQAGTVPWYQAELKRSNNVLAEKMAENVRIVANMKNCSLMLERMIEDHGLQHVLLGLECVVGENASIKMNDREKWRRASIALGKLARETEI